MEDHEKGREAFASDESYRLHSLRHSTAHVMAEAIAKVFPGAQFGIGPSIEDGFYYDVDVPRPITEGDLETIEAEMKAIVKRNSPFSRKEVSREEAVAVFTGQTYKQELIAGLEGDLTTYDQGGFTDLCRGPHVPRTGNCKHFKLMRVSGAYWRGDATRPQLQRVYGTVWPTREALDQYLYRLEEAKKRDHRKLGREMDLFHFQEEGPGVVFWHAKGWTMFQQLIAYMRRRLAKLDYDEVNAPQLLDKSLWETSGHWGWYKEAMFAATSAGETTEDDQVFAIKPMNCPGHVQIFKHGLRSYRELPLRLAEFGNVHRYEPSGALHGLMRVRGFTQDDAHIFCTEEQMAAECLAINDLILSTYKDFGFDNIVVKLSTRPEKRVGSDEAWDRAESIMSKVLEQIAADSGGKIKTAVNPGEGAFYGPKFEYVLRDAIGRDWQCGTTQVDFNLPERFGAFYIGADGEKKVPVMIHRAICGSMERFLGILIEHFAGHFPLWLAPTQVVVATITSEGDAYAMEVRDLLRKSGLRAEADLRNEKINYKVREHSVGKVPVILVVGKREMEERAVSVRRLGSQDQTPMTLDAVMAALKDEATPPDLKRE